MPATRKRQQGEEDFFDSFQQGVELKGKYQELQLKKRDTTLKTIQAMNKLKMDQQKLQLSMLKAGIDPFTQQPMQRGAFNPDTGEQQDVFFSPGHQMDPGAGRQGVRSPGNFGGGMVIPKGPPKTPAIRPDQLETDESGRTFVHLDNGVRMPATVQIGPGGRITSARTFTPGGRDAVYAVLQQFGEQQAPTVKPETPQIDIKLQPQFKETTELIDKLIMRDVKLDRILAEIDRDNTLPQALKTPLKQEARKRFGSRKRGAA